MNAWCEVLDIEVPSLERVRDHPEANTFTLMLVALLERGEPMTLDEVAARFEEAGIADAASARRSLARSRPGRLPAYRDGDRYSVDPHSSYLDTVVFMLGLRPPKVPNLRIIAPGPDALPGPDVALTPGELEEAFRGAYVASWSGLRLALAILDAHGPRLPGPRVRDIMDGFTAHNSLRGTDATFWRDRGIEVGEDGFWEIVPGHPSLPAARRAVRERVETERRRRAGQLDPAVLAAKRRAWGEERKANAAAAARLRRVLVCGFPPNQPSVVTILDPAARTIDTFFADEIERVPGILESYDLIAAADARPLLGALGFDPGLRRVADIVPPQKTMRINRQGRTLRITLELLVQGSCGISRPFGDPNTLAAYLEAGQTTRLRRRLEADAKSLFALYQYGTLHHAVRLRWGFIHEMLYVPWVQRDETSIYDLIKRAAERSSIIEVVIGTAPGWADPWARAVQCIAIPHPRGIGHLVLTTDGGWPVDERDVQAVREVG